jgi:hypothetical protein
MVRKLSPAETAAFLSRHPVDPADIPSYGLRITEAGHDYLVGVRHATGEIGVWDITAYDEYGRRIDPSIADKSYFERLLEATTESAKETFTFDIAPLLRLGLVVAGLYFAVQLIQGLKR